MSTELLRSTQEQETAPNSKVEALQPGELYALDNDTPSLEVRGSLSRLASFELGTGKAGEEGPLHPDDPRVAVIDVWKDDKGDFLVSPRSLKTVEEINEKAWRIAELPKQQLPLGRSRNELWQGVTGSPLPEQVSAQHFGIILGEDGKLNFVDVGSTNGTRMETALVPKPDVAGVPSAEEDDFRSMSGSLLETPAAGSESLPLESTSSVEKPPIEPTSIHERLGVKPAAAELATEPEKNLAGNEELDQTLRAMKGGADGLLQALRERPTMTSREQLEDVLMELAKQTAWLNEMSQKGLDPGLNNMLEGLRLNMQEIEGTARMVSSNMDQNVYRHGAEAHADRVKVEHQLEAYSNSLANIFRKLSERSQPTR